MGAKDKVQGEGDYEAAKRFDKAERDFVRSGKVDQAAREAEPRSKDEAREMEQAERETRKHGKGEDPNLRRGAGHKPA